MKSRIPSPEKSSDLRQRAERAAQDATSDRRQSLSAPPPPQPAPKAPEDTQRLLHELQVHQIELELQNEELRQAEAAAAASQARYFDLYDLAPVSYLTVCAKGVIREANLTVATLLGTTRDSLVQQPLSRYIHLDDLALFYQRYKKFFASGDPDSFDLQMVKADGTIFWAQHVVTPEPGSRVSSEGPLEGEPVCRIAISDLSERKQAEHALQTAYAELNQVNISLRAEIAERRKVEEALRESERRCREVVDFAVDGILLGSPEGLITEANKRLCTLFGLPRKELLGKNIKALPFKNESLEIAPFRFDLLQQGETIVRERVLTRPDGSEVVMEMHSKMMPDGTYQSIFRDITERKQAEAERDKLEAQNRQLQKSESLGRMAGAIAHHFNNQLGAVIGNLELAMTDPDDLDKRLRGAMASANKAAEVSSLMLTYLGQSVESKETLDLSEICRQSLPVLRTFMPKSVRLETDFPATGPFVTGNANQIHQVLTNLLTNAWEACQGTQGVIRITVNVAAPKEISSPNRFPLDSQTPVDSYVILEVKDTGNGIAREDMPNLFDPFFTRKFPGRGMGLAIVLGIVRAHQGFITVESRPESGSTFRLHFPQKALVLSALSENGLNSTVTQEQNTILLVEDEEVLCEVAAKMLMHLGFTVLVARDGVEALEMFQQPGQIIHGAIVDLTMPRMDGWETLTALRRLAPALPIILTSGYTKEQVMTGEHPEQPQVFLRKPFKLEHLREATCLALAQQRERGANRVAHRSKSAENRFPSPSPHAAENTRVILMKASFRGLIRLAPFP